jgi:hypothetical protein
MWDNIKMNLQQIEYEDQILPWVVEEAVFCGGPQDFADWIQLCPRDPQQATRYGS